MQEALKHTKGRVIIQIDAEGKNWYTFSNGTKIRRERQYNNLNRRETEPVNAVVVDAEYIPSGSEIIIHPNGIHDSNKIYNYNKHKTTYDESIQYYAIHEEQCFLWLDANKVWQPLKGFATALRVFKPYNGMLQGIEPTLVKQALYITSGEFKGLVVETVKSADYECIFMGIDGKDEQVIRLRHYENEDNPREEIIAIRHDLNEKLDAGELLVGLSPADAKTINENVSTA